MNFDFQEAFAYYQRQGAPQNQQALVALLREVQQAYDDILPASCLAEIASHFAIKESFLLAMIRRYPSLRTESAPYRLEVCGGKNCLKNSRLCSFIEETYSVRPGGISARGKFSYHVTGCMKHCGQGPNLKWNGTLYHRMNTSQLQALIEGN